MKSTMLCRYRRRHLHACNRSILTNWNRCNNVSISKTMATTMLRILHRCHICFENQSLFRHQHRLCRGQLRRLQLGRLHPWRLRRSDNRFRCWRDPWLHQLQRERQLPHQLPHQSLHHSLCRLQRRWLRHQRRLCPVVSRYHRHQV